MKKILKGFTLAEVIVTLTIVGVIVALTIPSLSLNVQKQQIGPALAKAINTLEHANKLALEQNQAKRLTDLFPIEYRDTIYAGKLNAEEDLINYYLTTIVGPHMKFSKVEPKPIYTRNVTNASQADISCNGDVYATPDNIYYSVNEEYGFAGRFVCIDVNGTKGPNIAGLDYLQLRVFDDGDVVPRAGRDYKAKVKELFDDDITLGQCPKLYYADCAGRIADNNYQVDY